MVTEFVSAEGILQAWERNRRYTKIENAHRPIGIQLFGADGNHMGEAARIILDHEKPDFIDINFGCPVPKVVGKNGGSSLLKDLPLLASVAGGVVKAVGERIPVTAKIRIGWDFQSLCAMDACRLLENEGISMITIHGRTRSQQYSGTANWDIIDECARAMSVPVIGNGDISTPQAVAYVKENTAVSGVMIGYICSAVTDFVVTFADDSDIVNLHGWSQGSFSGMSWSNVYISCVVVGITLILTFLLSKPIGAYQLGEAYAQSMGVNIKFFRVALILLSSILSATVTAFAGPISFVGIAVPFLMKRSFGTSRPLIIIPGTFLGGAVFCMMCDLIARMAFAPMELNISTVTSIFGAPIVIFMMVHGQKGR